MHSMSSATPSHPPRSFEERKCRKRLLAASEVHGYEKYFVNPQLSPIKANCGRGLYVPYRGLSGEALRSGNIAKKYRENSGYIPPI